MNNQATWDERINKKDVITEHKKEPWVAFIEIYLTRNAYEEYKNNEEFIGVMYHVYDHVHIEGNMMKMSIPESAIKSIHWDHGYYEIKSRKDW